MLNLANLLCYKNCWKIQQTLPQDFHLIVNRVKRGHMYFLLQFLVFFFAGKFKKNDAIKVVCLENLMLFVIKWLMPMKTIKAIWFQRLVYRLCPWLLLPPRKSFVEKTLLGLVEKIMTIYL